MEMAVFTEDSETTIDESDAESALDFFKGGFLSVKDLVMDLDEYGNVSVHILSNEYGYLRGSDSASRFGEIQDEPNEFTQAVSKASKTADVVVILLTRSTFEDIMAKQWSDLPTNAKEEYLVSWCI